MQEESLRHYKLFFAIREIERDRPAQRLPYLACWLAGPHMQESRADDDLRSGIDYWQEEHRRHVMDGMPPEAAREIGRAYQALASKIERIGGRPGLAHRESEVDTPVLCFNSR